MGCGSKPFWIPFWLVGEFTTHFSQHFTGDWDVHWGYGILTHGHIKNTHFDDHLVRGHDLPRESRFLSLVPFTRVPIWDYHKFDRGTCLFPSLSLSLSLSIYIYIYVRLYIYIYIYIHISIVYTHIYIYIHIHRCVQLEFYIPGF